jgi:hypothetical protein
VLLIALAGCSAPDMAGAPTPAAAMRPAPAPTAAVTVRPTPDIEQIRTRLQRADSLQGVASQCAAAINAPAELARVRVEPPAGDGCSPCSKLPLGYMDRGVPLSEVKLPLVDSSWIWLTVEDLLCIYVLDAGVFKPSSVTQW